MHTLACSQPRTYPEAFAACVADLFPALRATARWCPEVPADLTCARNLFAQNVTSIEVAGLFAHADLAAVYTYLRGGSSLCLPPEWRVLFPVQARGAPCQAAERPRKAARRNP